MNWRTSTYFPPYTHCTVCRILQRIAHPEQSHHYIIRRSDPRSLEYIRRYVCEAKMTSGRWENRCCCATRVSMLGTYVAWRLDPELPEAPDWSGGDCGPMLKLTSQIRIPRQNACYAIRSRCLWYPMRATQTGLCGGRVDAGERAEDPGTEVPFQFS